MKHWRRHDDVEVHAFDTYAEDGSITGHGAYAVNATACGHLVPHDDITDKPHASDCPECREAWTAITIHRHFHGPSGARQADVDRVFALQKSAPDMAAMLRELELDDGGKCPICYRNCDGMESYVHAPDCKLGRLLEAIGRQP